MTGTARRKSPSRPPVSQAAQPANTHKALPTIKLGSSSTVASPRSGFPLGSALLRQLARRWRPRMSALVRAEIGCSSSALSIVCSDPAQFDHGAPVSAHRYVMPSGGSLAIILPSACVIAATDRHYGGRSPLADVDAVSELSVTEDWMATRIADSIMSDLADLLPGRPLLDQAYRDHKRSAAFNADWPDAVARAELTITGLMVDPLSLELICSLANAQQLEDSLAADKQKAGTDASGAMARALASPMGDIRLRARIVLARPEIALSHLVTLAAGDQLRIAVPASLPLLVEDRILATGTLGAVGGMAAFRIADPRQEPA